MSRIPRADKGKKTTLGPFVGDEVKQTILTFWGQLKHGEGELQTDNMTVPRTRKKLGSAQTLVGGVAQWRGGSCHLTTSSLLVYAVSIADADKESRPELVELEKAEVTTELSLMNNVTSYHFIRICFMVCFLSSSLGLPNHSAPTAGLYRVWRREEEAKGIMR
ncbi:hypothetical protein PoB_005273600 [Plakobranchus ocellatus]|uniref:Uncharacterized protein n=1 Tax=Plakobranchus ocellatus TaxID=259542 RepID=A0AAV4BSL8_9GAST|nr:hypothetical protein PoB_005273600 [Plakobranchus ocellatus]